MRKLLYSLSFLLALFVMSPVITFASSTSTSLSQTTITSGNSFTWQMSGTRDCSTCVVNDSGGGASCSGNWHFSGNTRSGDYNWEWDTTCTAGSPGNYTFSSGKRSSNNNPCNGGWISQCTSSQAYTVVAPAPGPFSLSSSTSCSYANSLVSLSWSSSPNASYYNIYRNGSYLTYTYGTSYTDYPVTPGGSYYYFVVAVNSSGSYQSNNVGWFNAATCDTTPPTVNIISFPPNGISCFTPASWHSSIVQPLKMFVNDPAPSSGINNSTVGFKIIDAQNKATLQDFGTSYTRTSSDPSYNYYADLTNVALTISIGNPNQKFQLVAYAKDNAGNPSSGLNPGSSVLPSLGFTYDNSCAAPFIQTQNGDVHSNTQINVQGGP